MTKINNGKIHKGQKLKRFIIMNSQFVFVVLQCNEAKEKEKKRESRN